MKRDDFGMRIDNVRELATKYSKPELARMVQMGMVSPQEALMAGMMIDRIAKSAMQPPQTTVAQDVLAAAPTAAQAGIMGAPNAPPPSAGVAALPSGLQNMAGGGIVAFADGGDIPRYASRGLVAGVPEDMVRANDAANAALGTLSTQDQGLSLPGGYQFRPYDMPKGTDIKSEIAAQREAEREAGLDTDLYKRMREEEGMRKEDLARQREEAKGAAALALASRLFQARKGQEGQAVGAGISDATSVYSSALKEIRDTEKDIKKTQRELLFAEDRAKRDMSGKAISRVQAKQDKLDELQVRQTDQYNKAAEKASDLYITEFGIKENAKKALEVAKMSGEYQLAVARIHERYANRPTEGQQVLAEYHRILANQGPEKAEQYMRDWERAKGAGKPQNVYTMDDAMKAIASNPVNSGLNESQLAAKARKLYDEVNKTMGVAPSVDASSTSRPPTTFNLSPEAQKALQQYGGR